MTDQTPTRRERRERTKRLTLARRRWLYGILAGAGGVALVYGLVNPEQLAAWLVLGGALFGVTGTALANPTPD
ncbi:hypothetical protein BMH32_04720 [Leucobacter sp. OLJS4]|uniref:phage holin n=1 Tax=unclassified Leucobacter TaxID=2621730 RepID=UPI000C18FF1F|nr:MULTISPECIES: hypothetical protein [unclassified Leucobacter]PIJ06799.1 hypothetical protein BMH30_14270 [Leucobacter sp. OLES1]PII81556.1 hypothetical protein BMH25_13600 [Leucobacter sp. OLCALW19]PII86228.1 hypothetical protein BMH26_14020 [Leucobacter sp. OLTLW20]PII90123.1 hypothetical protein BMH27_12185 [Leucobacter sp. OLAS13]PII97156.1 hypothetical protein BMH29_12870 [Leucobacter sp. OLDS2]